MMSFPALCPKPHPLLACLSQCWDWGWCYPFVHSVQEAYTPILFH